MRRIASRESSGLKVFEVGKVGKVGSGGAMPERWIQLVNEGSKPQEGSKRLNPCFQVANVSKPRMSVKRITQNNNKVHFAFDEGDNFVENVQTGDRIPLKPNGRGNYMMEVNFVNGGRTQITMDSGGRKACLPLGMERRLWLEGDREVDGFPRC